MTNCLGLYCFTAAEDAYLHYVRSLTPVVFAIITIDVDSHTL
jgi:hypothetical protein